MIPKVKVWNFTGETREGTPVTGTVQAPTKMLAKMNVNEYSSYGVCGITIGGVVRKPSDDQKNNLYTVKAK